MTDYDSYDDTITHILAVQDNMKSITENLTSRALIHDQSKLHEPEKSIFDRESANLKELEYDSEEYHASLKRLGVALKHHYKHNDHHPEHYPDKGVKEMSFLSLLEMMADWRAATLRMKDGDFWKSMELNKKRFDIPDEIYAIMEKTAKELGW